MIQKEYFIKRQDTKKSDPVALSVLRTEPDNPTDATFVVQIIHGLCDRKERYIPLMQKITEAGGTAVIHDLRGFGNTVRSKDELGDLGDYGYNYELLCGDIDTVYASVSETPEDGELIECTYYPEIDTPSVPRYLLGFSSGALIASIYLAKDSSSVGGAILAGLPHREATVSAKLSALSLLSLITGDDAKPKFLHKRMTERYANKYAPGSAYDRKFAWYSSDPLVCGELAGDIVCSHRKTVRSHRNLLRILRDTYRPSSYNKPRNNLPVLIMAGEFDPEAGGDKKVLYSSGFFGDMGFAPVDIKMYRNMRHDIFHDIGCENVFADVIGFFRDHLDAENERLEGIRGEYTNLFDTADRPD